MSKKVLGIDLGTGMSAVSIYENGNVTVIPNAEGAKTTPSVVAFNTDGTKVVGQIAKRQLVMNPLTVVHSVKRLIGKKYSQVKDLKNILSYDIVEGKNGMAAVKIGDKNYTPEEISAMVLSKLKADAEAYLGETVSDAVITVPAYFGDAERKSTKDAGKIAGLNVLRLVNEPTAACLAYGLDKKDSKIIAVGDIGCGTSDISILEYGDGVFEVLATNGDALLGGDDLDEALMKYVAEEFKKENGVDILLDKQAKARLKEACEKAKCELSNAMSSSINLPFITADASGPKHLMIDLSRAKFEQIISPVIDKFEDKVRQCIKDSGKSLDEISDIIMVGGTTRVPYVQNFFKRIFGKDVNKTVNPDEVVSSGASIQGAVLGGDDSVGDVVLLDCISLSYGIETLGGVFTPMIKRGTTIPTQKTDTFSTAADMQTAISVCVYQGERTRAADNKLIGKFDLTGIPPAPKGVPQIQICYDVSSDGILTVTAKDLGTGKENHIKITQTGSLSEEEIDRMVKEAEANAEADKRFKDDQDTINKADSLIFNLEKQLNENDSSIPQEMKDNIKPLIDDVKKYREAKDIDNLKKSIDTLQQMAMKIGEEVYKNAQTQNDATPPPSSNQNDDGTIDAEVID